MVQETPSLRGRVIAITRAEEQAGETADLIEEMGGKPYVIPLLRFDVPEDLAPVREFVEALKSGGVDYAIFMSVNAVRFLLKETEVLGLSADLREGLKRTTTVAVGPRTAEELMRHGLRVDLIPRKYSSEGIAQDLKKRDLRGKKVFILRARGASPLLRNELKDAGALVKEIYVYEQRAPTDCDRVRAFVRDLASGKIDAIVFGSSQSVENFRKVVEELLGPDGLREATKHPIIVAIGPETAKALREIGLRADVVPRDYTFRDALTALARYLSRDS
jgi:uroporphyrinogen-III synthase